MNHLDEGTIHAWLDGALDAEHARDVEAHTQQCAACAAAVAEARGLIAASSRILNALDDVPAGVIPAGAPAAPRRPRRVWRAAPWVTGIAAVLLAAIVLRTTRDAPDYAEQARKMDEAQRSARVSLDTMKAAQTPSAPMIAPPSAPSVASAAVERRAADMESRAARSERALAQAAMAQEPAAGGAAGLAAEKATQPETRERAALPAAPTLADVVADNAARRVVPPDSLPASELAGCYVVQPQTRQGMVGKVAAMAEPAAKRAAAAPVAAAAQAEAFAPVPAGLVVRLDTLRGRAGFLVRSATSDSSLGWWRRVGRDTARVDLLTAGVFSFTPARRIPCPENPSRP